MIGHDWNVWFGVCGLGFALQTKLIRLRQTINYWESLKGTSKNFGKKNYFSRFWSTEIELISRKN
jgi:hypothetical protein